MTLININLVEQRGKRNLNYLIESLSIVFRTVPTRIFPHLTVSSSSLLPSFPPPFQSPRVSLFVESVALNLIRCGCYADKAELEIHTQKSRPQFSATELPLASTDSQRASSVCFKIQSNLICRCFLY